MKTSILAFLSVFLFTASQPTLNWKLDKGHSKLSFAATHLLISEITGEFTDYDVKISGTKEDFTDSKISVKINAKSIDTGNQDRDKSLRSREFFNTVKYPFITFEGTNFRWVSETKVKLTGILTINGISKVENFELRYGGTVVDPIDGITKVGFKLIGKINRLDYNLKWDVPRMADSYAVGEEVEITCNIRLNKESNS